VAVMFLVAGITATLAAGMPGKALGSSFGKGVTAILPAVLLIRVNPEDKGTVPYGFEKLAAAQASSDGPVALPEQTGLTRAEAIKTPAFYCTVLGIIFLSLSGMGMSTHAIAYFTDIGYPSGTASAAMSLVMTIMIGAKIFLGVTFDKIGPVPSAILTGSCMLASTIAIRFAGLAPFMPFVFSACFGFGYSTLTVPYSYLISQNFGTREFSAVYSLATTFGGLGGGFAATISGMLYDHFGSYLPVWNIYIGNFVVFGRFLADAFFFGLQRCDFLSRFGCGFGGFFSCFSTDCGFCYRRLCFGCICCFSNRGDNGFGC